MLLRLVALISHRLSASVSHSVSQLVTQSIRQSVSLPCSLSICRAICGRTKYSFSFSFSCQCSDQSMLINANARSVCHAPPVPRPPLLRHTHQSFISSSSCQLLLWHSLIINSFACRSQWSLACGAPDPTTPAWTPIAISNCSAIGLAN